VLDILANLLKRNFGNIFLPLALIGGCFIALMSGR
jgi:hypothetical protein